jgi:hypothetical protein
MAIQEKIDSSLNEQQVMMLRLLKDPMPAADFNQIRRLAVKLLSKQLDTAVERWEDEQSLTAEDHEEMSKGHFRTAKRP